MGKRYFCDYCDRSFQDNLHNRKKHLNGVQHLRAKRAWYDLFRDAAAILQEEQSKKPCRKFLQTGQCDFGANCRFSHMTEQDLEKLSAQVQGGEKALPRGAGLQGKPGELLCARAAFRAKYTHCRASPRVSSLPEKPLPFQYPPGWPPPQELPPSLQAPPPGGWPLPPDLQWG
ncbi:Zinc finger matrin-type protein 5 [Aix galericulata]|nr:Zinc finger matrin-type protein 5 [Aix galericulata]